MASPVNSNRSNALSWRRQPDGKKDDSGKRNGIEHLTATLGSLKLDNKKEQRAKTGATHSYSAALKTSEAKKAGNASGGAKKMAEQALVTPGAELYAKKRAEAKQKSNVTASDGRVMTMGAPAQTAASAAASVAGDGKTASADMHPTTLATTGTPTVGTPGQRLVVRNVHQDDIHGMIRVGPTTFVTGSKDGALKLWNDEGELVKSVWEPHNINYREWITALTAIGVDRWMSGTRNGYIDLWDNTGKRLATFEPDSVAASSTSTSHKCKERNFNRINCMAQGISSGNDIYYVGRPTQFTVHRLAGTSPIDGCSTSPNDWVYCITPLTDRKVMVVTGAHLDILEKKSSLWEKTALIKEEKTRGEERPFISSVNALQDLPGYYSLAVFGGSVVVIDINAQRVLRTYREHSHSPKESRSRRVWATENIRPNIFASCSDDYTIKLWDVRLARSCVTLSNNIGRVSTILKISDTTLVSGSCPDNLKTSKEKAQLTFWDIRQV